MHYNIIVVRKCLIKYERRGKKVFLELNSARPIISSIEFKHISVGDNLMLVAPFSIEDIKETIWSCDGKKTPG